ncbi:MAG: hypothetical protein GOV01_00205 [Candidatus Altiarchaeota archaeon]|nr:hypothetical protein [Candidatus Altiarchaeota archaeon]
MSTLEILWNVLIFVLSLFAGLLAGNFFGESRAESFRYKYLGGGKP